MARPRKPLHPDAPLLLNDHRRPRTRRDFLGQGFSAGLATVMASPLLSLLANSAAARECNTIRDPSCLSGDIEALRDNVCGIASQGAGKIPFICMDLAGGANISGSNVLVGGRGGQLDFLSTAGYSKLGLPGDMTPAVANPGTGSSDFINTDLGLAFHSDSAFLRGILERCSPATLANVNGAVIPARSDNDTGNNPHNPMYGINRAGSDGSLLTLIGSSSSDSGGNSMAPVALIDPTVRPTKVDRPSDVTGLVDVGDLVSLLEQSDAVAVMESMARISDKKLARVNTKKLQSLTDTEIKTLLRCGYVKSADLADRFGNPATLNPDGDPFIVGQSGIFSSDEFTDREFRKTASVMKLVVNGFAGAGTISMGGYDYHTGDRSSGEIRDLRAGRCMGACLEYAARMGKPLMLYVFSDGSVASNGMIDNSVDGRGKGVWTGDNSSTAAAFFLVYNPTGRATLMGADTTQQARHQQIGYMRADASVETASSPAANNVNLLVQSVILNYMALHGEQGQFGTLFPGHGLGNAALMDSMTAFAPIVSGTIGNPV